MLWDMKNHPRLLLPALLLLLLAACSSPKEVLPPEVDVSGDWAGTATVQVVNETFPVRLRLEQTGAAVTGQLHAGDEQSEQAVGPVSGSVAGTELTLSLTFDNGIVDVAGTFSGTVGGTSLRGSGTVSLADSGQGLPVKFNLTKQ